MQIGNTIRKYRLEKNLTQGEVAGRLGVTAPAVNKWEKGHSMPDITLLSPLARLLDITLDTLLSHTGFLPDEEASRIVVTAHEKLKAEPFEEVFAWAKHQIQLYPDSDFLAFYMARVLHGHLQMLGNDGEEEYTPYFISCYQRTLESGEEALKNAAADALYYHHMGPQTI